MILPILTIILSCAVNAQTQQAVDKSSIQGEVVLAKLSPPQYPDIARRTRISGDVELNLGIRKDGSIESAVVVRGHELLNSAALDIAQKSVYECRNCRDAVNPYSMVFSFQFGKLRCSPPDKPGHMQVTQLQNHIMITLERQLTVSGDPFSDAKPVRSAKCLYLWRCSLSERSLRCLYLWKCGMGRYKWKPDLGCPEIIH
jgi:TonB family protein